MLFGGFYSNLGKIPGWVSWIKYISVNKNYKILLIIKKKF